MKKTPRKQKAEVDDVRPAYQFDYSRAKPNRFASRMKRPVVAVVLESDVAAVFDSSAKVNAQLRSGSPVVSVASRQRGRVLVLVIEGQASRHILVEVGLCS